MRVVSPHRAGEDVKKPAPQDTQTRSRLIIGQNGPSDSALAATSGWRLLAAQPLTGTLRAALLGACARACVPRRYTPSIGQNGPSDSALAAASGWRLLAAQPLTGTLRAALLGACARACVPRRYTPSEEGKKGSSLACVHPTRRS